jgi:hypothetical protein
MPLAGVTYTLSPGQKRGRRARRHDDVRHSRRHRVGPPVDFTPDISSNGELQIAKVKLAA